MIAEVITRLNSLLENTPSDQQEDLAHALLKVLGPLAPSYPALVEARVSRVVADVLGDDCSTVLRGRGDNPNWKYQISLPPA